MIKLKLINDFKSNEGFRVYMKRPEPPEAIRNAGDLEAAYTIILDVNEDGSLN